MLLRLSLNDIECHWRRFQDAWNSTLSPFFRSFHDVKVFLLNIAQEHLQKDRIIFPSSNIFAILIHRWTWMCSTQATTIQRTLPHTLSFFRLSFWWAGQNWWTKSKSSLRSINLFQLYKSISNEEKILVFDMFGKNSERTVLKLVLKGICPKFNRRFTAYQFFIFLLIIKWKIINDLKKNTCSKHLF